MNAGTVFVLVIVLALVAIALRSVIKKKGSCGCSEGADVAAGSGCSGCSGCTTAKVYGINVDAAGMPLRSDCGDCCHCADKK